MDHERFRAKYGPWALVAGASEGLGAAFARALGKRGLNLVILARRADKLAAVADELRETCSVSVRADAIDLKDAELEARLSAYASELEIGLGIYNAAYAPIGPFLARPMEELSTVIDVNVRGPLTLARTLAPPMVERGRGGLVLMSSLAGIQGTPRLATYAGSKAFNNVFGESLWHELKEHGVDVEVCCAGAIRTPGYESAANDEAPGTLDPDVVAEKALHSLGRGPLSIPGFVNQTASMLLGRLLPRRTSINIMAKNTKDLS